MKKKKKSCRHCGEVQDTGTLKKKVNLQSVYNLRKIKINTFFLTVLYLTLVFSGRKFILKHDSKEDFISHIIMLTI